MTEAVEKYNIDSMPDLQRFTGVLQKFCQQNNLVQNIAGNNYVRVEGWQFAGACFGLGHKITKCQKISDDRQKVYIYYHDVQMYNRSGAKWIEEKPYLWVILNPGEEVPPKSDKHKRQLVKTYFAYETEVELFNYETGQFVGNGYAVCSNTERAKLDFDEYAIESMAQTRATGKAFRLKLGYVFKLAGFEGTPAEEMQNDMGTKKGPSPKQQTKTKRTPKEPTAREWEKTKEALKTGTVDRETIEGYYILNDEHQKELDQIINGK